MTIDEIRALLNDIESDRVERTIRNGLQRAQATHC